MNKLLSILVVHPSSALRLELTQLLREVGYTVKEASTSQACLSKTSGSLWWPFVTWPVRCLSFYN